MLQRSIQVLLVTLAMSMGAMQTPAAVPVERLRDVPDGWFASAEGKSTIANIISWQNANGGWWKSYDTLTPRPADAKSESTNPAAPKDSWSATSTFDNQATYTELTLLARAVTLTNDDAAKDAFQKGLQFVFDAQYDHGGFPQRFPLEKGYGRYITFNDGAMAGTLKVLRDAGRGAPPYAFLDEATRAKCLAAFNKGIECILLCQIKVDGKLTAWCQQHDEVTFAPQLARAYELPSICSTESSEIAQLLMSIENPGPEIRAAVKAAAEWFERSKIHGKRYDRLTDADGRVSRLLSDDPNAPPLWARFYDIDTNRPFFCDRDGVKRWDLNEVGEERRRGYAWYSTAPANFLKHYPQWLERTGG
ncbi:MAG TPA: pectate lyase [Tepidisphaeraceae bacterium]|nr:pectate lyase [Tepidisphaeraceae bacterium]